MSSKKSYKTYKGNDILVTYTGENWEYRNSKVMYFAGKQNAGQDTVDNR
jgi:hypothetical protein